MKRCFNPKLLIAAAVVAAAVYAFAPDLFVAALPLLVLALCPLMMWVMMRLMMKSGEGTSAQGAPTGTAAAGSHPSPVVRDEPAAGEADEAVGEIERLRARLAEFQRGQHTESTATLCKDDVTPPDGTSEAAAATTDGEEDGT